MSGTERERGWETVWDDIFASREFGKYPSEHLIRFVARNWYAVPDRSQVRLLDLGSGPGAGTWYMTREGFSVSAIDGSKVGIERLQARLSHEGLHAEARVGDYGTLPWPDGTFDGVIDNASICHNRFEHCKRVVAEVRRVLKPGGRFYSASFTPNCWGFGLGTCVEPNGFRDIPEGPIAGQLFCLFFSLEQLRELFSAFGEVIVDRASWTLDGMSHLVEMWIVACRKDPRA
jgi:SAM-dependent methyltransferase